MAVVAASVLVVCPVAGSAQKVGSVRDVDFLNRAYGETLCAEEGTTITVTNGVFERTDEDDRAYFKVLEVVYGDLTGDGADEAVVLTICNTGGTGQFSDGLVYTVRSGALVLLTTLGVGDRADGGIHNVAVENGVLRVERYGTGEGGGACCPQVIDSQAFQWNGKKFVPKGRSELRSYVDALNMEGAAPYRVQFRRNTSGAVLVGLTTAADSFLVGARKGQKLLLQLDTDDDTSEVVVIAPGGAQFGRISGNGKASLVLPATGDFTLKVNSRASKDATEGISYTLSVVIE
jgi:hypothetical protein